MCIFSGEIESISATKILASVVYPCQVVSRYVEGRKKIIKSPDLSKPMQLTIYSNKIAIGMNSFARTPAMILPFPLKRGANRIRIIDLSEYNGIFDDLDLLFSSDSSVGSRMWNVDDDDDSYLKIHKVGKYSASIVPNFESFDQLQYSKFNLLPDTYELLKKYYKKGYGFIVCQLDSASEKYEREYQPFAYCHELKDNKLFIPTRHYYSKSASNPYAKYQTFSYEDYENHPDLYYEQEIDTNSMNTLATEDKWLRHNIKRQRVKKIKEKEETYDPRSPRWDHEIYVINCPRILRNPLLNKPGARVKSAGTSKLQSVYTYLDPSKIPMNIAFGKINSVEKIKIENDYKYNYDFML
jgi:hypothetical protein